MNATLFALAVFDGIAYAAMVFMVAVGLTMIFGVLRVLNVAHGSFYAIGAYISASLGLALISGGAGPWLAYPVMILAAGVVGLVLGGLIERFLLRRIYDKEEVLQLLVTFAVFMILEDVQRLIWGVNPLWQSSASDMLGTVEVFGVIYSSYQLILMPLAAVAVILGLRFFLRRTLSGRLILAVTEDREAATAIGIDADRVYLMTFVIGAALAGLGGALHSASTSVLPGIGANMIVLSFAVAATAGLGQIEGAALAALLIGLGRSFAVYLAPELADLMPYLIMLLRAAHPAGGAFRRGEGAKDMTLRAILPVLLFLAVAALPILAPWSQVVLTLVTAKGLAVLGIVVLLHAGQVSFGHALFFGVAAYGAAFIGKWFAGGELLLMLLFGTGAAVLIGLLAGLFVVRYRYIFFGMLNLALSMILYSALEKFYHITGGDDGMQIARPTVLGVEMEREPFEALLCYGGLALAIAVAYAVHRFLNSPVGNMMKTIKTNETRLEYLGVSARRTLLVGYLVSAALCGVGGAMMAVAQGVVTPQYAFWIRSGELVFIAILGGAQSVSGAFVGALVYELVRNYAAAFAADYWQMILGFVLLAVILFAPHGLVGLYKAAFGDRR